MTLGELSAWIVVNPFELTESDQMIVEVETADHIIRKCITKSTINFGMRQVITLNMGIDSSCEIIQKGTLTYAINGSIWGDVPDNVSIMHSGSSSITSYEAITFTLRSWGSYTVTGITMNVIPSNKDSNARYSIESNKTTLYSGNVNSSTWEQFNVSTEGTLSLLPEGKTVTADTLSVTFRSNYQKWTVKSLTITYE